MKNRFYDKKNAPNSKNSWISFSFFALVILAFWLGVSSVSERNDKEELQTLERAVFRGVTYCYATEGTYPESLDYLKENYGLTYNEEKYFVDYQPLGANIMPDVTIIKKRTDREGFR